MKSRFLLTLIFLCLLPLSVQAQQPSLTAVTKELCPEIPSLTHSDIMFNQYSSDVEQFYKDFAAKKAVSLFFYTYTVKKDDDLLSLSGRCNIPYDTIASLNCIADAKDLKSGTKIFIPSGSGIFVLKKSSSKNQQPLTDIEGFLQNSGETEDSTFTFNINGRIFDFYAGKRFDQTTRSFFLDTKMKMPLEHYWVSSNYGIRQNPLGVNNQFHKGIDFAAPQGTKVFACKHGTVSACVKNDRTFGNYIVIKHPSGLSSIYAHLSKISVEKGQKVETGQEIGLVGMTGAVTGAHLHFEIRLNGQATDPNIYLKR